MQFCDIILFLKGRDICFLVKRHSSFNTVIHISIDNEGNNGEYFFLLSIYYP